MIDYSVVICVYNPDERILSRCLQSVVNLNREGIVTEVIVADNNSEVRVDELAYVKRFSQQLERFTYLHVVQQGVKYARMAAIEASQGKYIVYIDSDNEPERDYLQELKKLNTTLPEVAAWGPGNVSVDFIDGINAAIEDQARIAFQERHDDKLMFDTKSDWQHCYPFGTGMCTQASLLRDYIELARQGRFTLEGRSGTKLTSGEDTQMVLLCISKGYAAGVSPTLRVSHIIPASRANWPYLKKLAYGTSFCYHTCVLQVFPDRREILEAGRLKTVNFSKEVIRRYFSLGKPAVPGKVLALVNFIGMEAGKYSALNKTLPTVVKKIMGYLEVQ